MSNLVIVESPTKARTIKRFLGKDFTVEASMGHVRDLPQSTLGVDPEKDFTAVYEVPREKEATVKRLKDAYKKADTLWIATDEDREGEAIGWHLIVLLGARDPGAIKRIVFHEITESAIRAAVASPRTIDHRLVDAQNARRILDRLVGYTLSPFLWKKVYSGLSAGRVQSVAVRIIVDREREIRAFTAEEYWTIAADLSTEAQEHFTALLQKRDGKKFVPVSEAESSAAVAELKGAVYRIGDVEEKDVHRTPPPPFTTSTLQQEAGRKLGFSVKQTMVVAQQLYEGMDLGQGAGPAGLITYMRTDSVNLSDKALADAAATITRHFGREYVLSTPRKYKTKSKGAQEAHEAIRPTELERTPESLKGVLDAQQLKLYTLVWNRTIATQMPPAEFRRIGADVQAGRYLLRATGQTVTFDGYLRVYAEGRDEPEKQCESDDSDGEALLPPLTKGQALSLQSLLPEQHFTKPPPRYTEASLVKKLEDEGIGRPSTYAPTISTVQQRGYVQKDGGKLVPTEIAFMVTDLLAEHFPRIVDLGFTAEMEQKLDDIAEGKAEHVRFLSSFYRPFKELVDSKSKEIQKKDVLKEYLLGTDPKSGLPVVARTGRFGPYVQIGRLEEREKTKKKKGEKKKKASDLKTASLPKNSILEKVTLEQALALLQFPKNLGMHDGAEVTVLLGRFGPYIKCAEATVALPKDVEPASVTLEQAIMFIAEAKERRKKAQEPLRDLGNDTSGNRILVKDGRFGPYVTDGTTNASLGKKRDPQTITLEDAVELLQKKRERGPSKWRMRG